jgi:hypothetical protein
MSATEQSVGRSSSVKSPVSVTDMINKRECRVCMGYNKLLWNKIGWVYKIILLSKKKKIPIKLLFDGLNVQYHNKINMI